MTLTPPVWHGGLGAIEKITVELPQVGSPSPTLETRVPNLYSNQEDGAFDAGTLSFRLTYQSS